jgi:uncharacterized BrkB/YihY/UPF0761 family membrane protein
MVTEPDETEAGGRVNAFVATARQRMKAEQDRFTKLLAKYEDRPLIDTALRTYRRDHEVAGTVVSSAVAFRLFLFFVPMLLFFVGVAGFLSGWVEAEDVSEQAGLTGGVAAQIRTAFEQPGSTRWVALLLGLFGIVTTGRTLSKVMVASSSLAWRLTPTTKASVKVIGGLVGLISGIGLLAALVSRVRAEFGVAVTGASFLVVLVGYVIGWLAVSMLLPRASRDPGVLLPGAVLVGVTLTGMQVLSQVYLPDKIGRASHLYGAVGTTIVTLGWFFIAGRAIVLAMCLDAVIHERFGTISRLVFSLPLLRILGRKSTFIRRFFDLDEEPGSGRGVRPLLESDGGDPGRGGGEHGGRDGVDPGQPGLQGSEEQAGHDQAGLRGHPGGGADDEGVRG